MRQPKSAKDDAEMCTKRQLVGLRMPAAEYEECRKLAKEDDRSVAQFALMIHRLGLATYKKQSEKRSRRPA